MRGRYQRQIARREVPGGNHQKGNRPKGHRQEADHRKGKRRGEPDGKINVMIVDDSYENEKQYKAASVIQQETKVRPKPPAVKKRSY